MTTTSSTDTSALKALDLKTEQGRFQRDVLLFLCDDSGRDPLFRGVDTGVSIKEAREQKRVGEIPPRVPRRLRSPMEWVAERRAEAETAACATRSRGPTTSCSGAIRSGWTG